MRQWWGFLLYRQLDSAKLKAEAWKVFDLPGWLWNLSKGKQNWERNFYPEWMMKNEWEQFNELKWEGKEQRAQTSSESSPRSRAFSRHCKYIISFIHLNDSLRYKMTSWNKVGSSPLSLREIEELAYSHPASLSRYRHWAKSWLRGQASSTTTLLPWEPWEKISKSPAECQASKLYLRKPFRKNSVSSWCEPMAPIIK